jgi:hypothetical protein
MQSKGHPWHGNLPGMYLNDVRGASEPTSGLWFGSLLSDASGLQKRRGMSEQRRID